MSTNVKLYYGKKLIEWKKEIIKYKPMLSRCDGDAGWVAHGPVIGHALARLGTSDPRIGFASHNYGDLHLLLVKYHDHERNNSK